jgi:formylglycine-generating enzyme required for sulfatase activity/uncharacterized membrane protein
LVVVVAAGHAHAQWIVHIGVLPGGTGSWATDVCDAGPTVVGWCGTPSGERAVRWTPTGPLQDLGVLPGGSFSFATAISHDGGTVVGHSGTPSGVRAFRWTEAGGLQGLGVLPFGTFSYALAVSGDGSVVVGYGNMPGGERAFRWTQAEGMQPLAPPSGFTRARATGVSADGTVIVGWGRSDTGAVRAIRWSVESGTQAPGFAIVNGVSSDGRVMVGVDGPGWPYAHATRWTQGVGWELLDTVLPGGSYAEATSTSDDGLTVVGFGDSVSGDRAVIWDYTQGSSSLEAALSMRGIATGFWVFSEASAVSESARFVVGNGAIGGAPRGFVASLGPPCRSDLSGDRFVNGDDLGRLLSDWGGAGPADLNRDGVVDGNDLGLLLAIWGECPFEPLIITPAWATLVEARPDPVVVTDPALRAAIVATGRPWRVRDTATQVEMLLVPPGTFHMGCIMSSNQHGCSEVEYPVHQVTLTNAFYLGRYEVTQAQWMERMGSNPSNFQSASTEVPADQVPNRPVERVSWTTIQGYLSATGFRLPTEAEWEYACRAGTQTPFFNGSTDGSTLGTLAWYSPNSGGQTRPVGGKLANAFGFHDMLGNVREWVNDWYGGYTAEAQTDPTGPVSALYRTFRGGAWNNITRDVSSSTRAFGSPSASGDVLGFRVARTP